jgi:FkbM family methyltransferase
MNNITKILKLIVEILSHTRIYTKTPRGINLKQDIYHFIPTYCIDVIFDVGANVGQSAKLYLNEFPNSYIYCFEPVKATFIQLKDNIGNNKRVHCYQLALGSSKRIGEMVLKGDSDLFFLSGQLNSKIISEIKETVSVITIDEFCKTQNIDHISLLKIDTEGGDLDVLLGSLNMLTSQRIDFLQIEAGMNPNNLDHISFEKLKEYLESHDYFLFGIYDQVHEWKNNEMNLRRVNPVFISKKMIWDNRLSS